MATSMRRPAPRPASWALPNPPAVGGCASTRSVRLILAKPAWLAATQTNSPASVSRTGLRIRWLILSKAPSSKTMMARLVWPAATPRAAGDVSASGARATPKPLASPEELASGRPRHSQVISASGTAAIRQERVAFWPATASITRGCPEETTASGGQANSSRLISERARPTRRAGDAHTAATGLGTLYCCCQSRTGRKRQSQTQGLLCSSIPCSRVRLAMRRGFSSVRWLPPSRRCDSWSKPWKACGASTSMRQSVKSSLTRPGSNSKAPSSIFWIGLALRRNSRNEVTSRKASLGTLVSMLSLRSSSTRLLSPRSAVWSTIPMRQLTK